MEERIRKLELNEAAFAVELKNLISTMNNLLNWIKALVITSVPGLGFLIWQAFNK
jgi:hypothetical protein